MQNLREGLSVGVGAALGACTRLGLTMALGAGLWPVLGINILGSFLMGRYRPGPFWGTGYLGGFTTFSAFAVLLTEHPPLYWPLHILLAVAGCTAAWLVGDNRRRA